MAAAGSLSARGVAGERTGGHDGHVPNYNIFGQQHHRLPTKDKSHFTKIVKDKPEWQQVPKHRTRSELFAARRAAKHPDLSYDFDGDGAVGATDYFIGKHFGQEQDYKLNAAERHEAVQALENGFLDRFSFGHDHFGAKRPFPVKQIRGKIISVDNVGELSEVYPPHWNADKVPRFATRTEMNHHRRAELINAADELRTEHDKKFPDKVNEPEWKPPPKAPVLGQSNSVRREARRREARDYAGLELDNTHINPHREAQSGTTLNYIEEPADKTRLGMFDRRAKEMRAELHQNRREGEKDYVPMVARHTTADSLEYDERRADKDALTRTKLMHQRKAEKIEHNMTNFQLSEVVHPRYCEQEEAWWRMQKDYVHNTQPCALRQIIEPVKEVTGKVTGVSIPIREAAERLLTPASSGLPSNFDPSSGRKAFDEAEDRTLQRWTTEFMPQKNNQHAPRYFDGVKQAPTFSMDTAELDQLSSFECIAKTSIMQNETRQRQVAGEDEERASSWKLSIRGQTNHNDRGPLDDFEGVTAGGVNSSISRELPSMGGQQPLTAREPKRGVPLVPRIPSRSKADPPLPQPLGEDVPMTERLDRIITGRNGGLNQTTGGRYLGNQTSNAGLATVGENKTAAMQNPSPSSGALRGGDRTTLAATQPKRASGNLTTGGTGETTRYPDSQGLVVRTGGFQWIQRQQMQAASLQEDASNSSLLKTPQPPQETPPRSRSVSRTLQRKMSPTG